MTSFAGHDDAALAALMLPFATGALAWPHEGRVLFVHARDGWPLQAVTRGRIVCEQPSKPLADALQRGGLAVEDVVDETFPLVLLLPPRQRDQARADLARAVRRMAPGGTLVTSVANNDGARSHGDDMRKLLGPAMSLSKHHCRVAWATLREATLDHALLAEWIQRDAPRAIADGRFTSRPGVFAWDRIDAGSELLATHVPGDLSGRVADLGAGFGYLSCELLARCAGISALDLYEADARALALARLNVAGVAASCATAPALDFLWHDVASGLPRRYGAIVTNPPFHQGRADAPDLGRAFIASAADALVPGGRLFLVANTHLPYEALLRSRFADVRVLAAARGYKVLAATMAGA